MVIVVLVVVWVAVACGFALVLGRSLDVTDRSDRWRDGRREVRDLSRSGFVEVAPVAADQERAAA